MQKGSLGRVQGDGAAQSEHCRSKDRSVKERVWRSVKQGVACHGL